MSNIDLNIPPWTEQKDHSIVCRYCGNPFRYFLDFLNAHAPDCPWLIAYNTRGEKVRESMVRQHHRRQLLTERKD